MRTVLLEALLILLVLWPLARHEGLIRLFRNLNTRHTIFTACLFGALAAGQLASVNSFPFVTWDMYGRPESGDPDVYEYTGVLASGKTVPLVPSRILSSIAADRIISRLHAQVETLYRKAPRREAELRAEHEGTLAALARLYNRKFPGDPLQTVMVSSRTIHLDAYSNANSSKTVVLWQVRIPEVDH
jgi:hypothetical protein